VTGDSEVRKAGKQKGVGRTGKASRGSGRTAGGACGCTRRRAPSRSAEVRLRQDRKEVTEKHDEAVRRQALGLPDESGDVLIGDYLHRWLDVTLPEYVRAGAMQESTMDSYRDNVELHIIPAGSGVPTLRHIGLLELSAPMVRGWMDKLRQKPSGRVRTKLRKGEAELPPPPEAVKRHGGIQQSARGNNCLAPIGRAR
jgi:hypothetical protein